MWVLALQGDSTFILGILHEFHNSIVGGHYGFLRTYKWFSRDFKWIWIKATIKQYVEEYIIYQQNKTWALSLAKLLNLLLILNCIKEDISINFIKGLPRSEGFNSTLAVVDKLSKYVHFYALRHTYTTQEVTVVFIKEIV